MQRSLLALAVAVLAAASSAQALRLERQPASNPGSYPGTLGVRLTPGGSELAAILFSFSPGPIPLVILDPRDNRQLDVGPPFAAPGGFMTGGIFAAPVFPVPDDPTFLDATIYIQGFTVSATGPTLVDRISNPAPARLAPAFAFRDRFTQFTTPRAFFPVIERADQRWMMLGGGSGALLAQIATDKTETYDPLTDSFVAGPNMTVPRSLHTATRLQDGRYLIAGGVNVTNDPQTAAEIYDPVADTFTAIPPMASPRMGHSATLLNNGKVLIAGGLSDLNGTGTEPINSTLASTELYNPQTNSWSAGPNLRSPRAGQGVITLSDGRLLIAGGIGWTLFIIVKIPAIFATCDIYNPQTNQISAGPSMATGRAIFPIAELGGGRRLVCGGLSVISTTNPGAPTDRAEIFDEGAMQWSNAGQMAQARGNHAAMALDGNRFLFIGGAAGDVFTPIALGTTEIYNVGTGQWSAGPAMSDSRAAFGFFQTPLGQGHLLGGASGSTAAVSNTTDWFYR